MARTQIEVNLLFCTNALPKVIIISKTENKVTVVNWFSLGPGSALGEKGEKTSGKAGFQNPAIVDPQQRFNWIWFGVNTKTYQILLNIHKVMSHL